MWQDNKEVVSPAEKQKMLDMQSTMETLLTGAIDKLQDEGVCIMVLYKEGNALRMAHISNVRTPYLILAMKEWIKIQEGENERDHFDG